MEPGRVTAALRNRCLPQLEKPVSWTSHPHALSGRPWLPFDAEWTICNQAHCASTCPFRRGVVHNQGRTNL